MQPYNLSVCAARFLLLPWFAHVWEGLVEHMIVRSSQTSPRPLPCKRCSHHIILAPTNRQGEELQIALRGFMCSGLTGSTKTPPEGTRLLPASIGPHKSLTTRHLVFTIEPACSGSSLKTSSTIEFSGLCSLNNVGSPIRRAASNSVCSGTAAPA